MGHWANTTLCGDLEGDMKDCFTVEVGEMNEGDLVYNSVAQQQNRGLCVKKLGRFPFILNQGYIDHLSSRLCCFLGRCLGWRFSRSSLSGLSFSRHYGPYWEICCVTLCVLQTSKGFWVFLSRNWTITKQQTLKHKTTKWIEIHQLELLNLCK